MPGVRRLGTPAPIATMHVRMSREQRKFLVGLERSRFGRHHKVLVAFVREVFDDDLLGLAAELSYRWLFALFPVMIMLAAISRFVAESLSIGDPTSSLIDAVGAQLPAEAASLIKPQLEAVLSERNLALLSFALLFTAYAASSGMKALIKSLNRAYDLTEVRPFGRRLVIAFALTVLLATSVVVFFVLLLGGQEVTHELASSLGVGPVALGLFEALRYPLSVAALALASGFLYWAAPACNVRPRSVLPGVLLFVPAWIGMTMGFGVYITEVSSYGETYGSISGIIVLLVWLYAAALILLLGGELNATIEQYHEAERARRARLAARRAELIAERKAGTVAAGHAGLVAEGQVGTLPERQVGTDSERAAHPERARGARATTPAT
jgi:membrane protein